MVTYPGKRNPNWKGGKRKTVGGYIVILVGPNELEYEHIVIAERAVGHKLPDGAEVHHADGDGTNNANTNLVICEDRGYHMILHARQRVVDSGGDPNTDQFCNKCKHHKPFAAFAKGKHECRSCASIRFRQWRRKNEEDV